MTKFLLFMVLALNWDWWPTGITGEHSADSLCYTASLSALASGGSQSPFWIRTGRDGAVSSNPFSVDLGAGVVKKATNPGRWFDYDFAASVIAGIPDGLRTNLTYAHARLFIFDMTVGVKPLSFGPTDENLTTGGLLFSRNALPMPRVTVGIDNYTAVPGFFGYLEGRIGLSHIWQNDETYVRKGFIHHKFAGLRLGGPLPVNLSYEFHHAAQWGGYSPDGRDLGNSFSDYKRIFFGKGGGSEFGDQVNAQGNHLASHLMTLDIKWTDWKLSFYWQNIIEDSPVYFLGQTMNASDGLWGINLSQKQWPYISSVTLEYLNTTDQSGPWHDKDGYIFGGNDQYYSNYLYLNGWTYHGLNIGNPMLEPLNSGFRLRTFFAGLKGNVLGVSYRAFCSYSQNFGDNNTSTVPVNDNLGIMLELSRRFPSLFNLEFALSIASDIGSRYGKHAGAFLVIRKTGFLTKW